MSHYLTFTIAAPLASFGTVAVGGRRTASSRPTKSQILGLVAAALGIPRTAETELAALTASLGYAVRVETSGIAETDYHTAQIPPTTRKRRYATRPNELAVPKYELTTELSWREFRSGFRGTVCLWPHPGASISLQPIGEHLARPIFTLYLGRKAFPLMIPCFPVLLEAPSIATAFRLRDAQLEDRIAAFDSTFGTGSRRTQRPHRTAVVYADNTSAEFLGLRIARREQARDLPDNRAKWRFRVRNEVVADWQEAP